MNVFNILSIKTLNLAHFTSNVVQNKKKWQMRKHRMLEKYNINVKDFQNLKTKKKWLQMKCQL